MTGTGSYEYEHELDAERECGGRQASDAELALALQRMSEDRLADNYAIAMKHPETLWARQLAAEAQRRGLLGTDERFPVSPA